MWKKESKYQEGRTPLHYAAALLGTTGGEVCLAFKRVKRKIRKDNINQIVKFLDTHVSLASNKVTTLTVDSQVPFLTSPVRYPIWFN